MQGEVQVVGALFAVMNGLCYALYLFMTKKLRAGSGMEPTDILLLGLHCSLRCDAICIADHARPGKRPGAYILEA